MDTLTTRQRAVILFTVLNGEGNPASIDGFPRVASSDETVIAATVEATGNQSEYRLTVNSVAPSPLVTDPDSGNQVPRVDRITVTVDGDLGPGERNVTGMGEFTVVADPRDGAATLSFGAATIEDKPAA